MSKNYTTIICVMQQIKHITIESYLQKFIYTNHFGIQNIIPCLSAWCSIAVSWNVIFPVDWQHTNKDNAKRIPRITNNRCNCILFFSVNYLQSQISLLIFYNETYVQWKTQNSSCQYNAYLPFLKRYVDQRKLRISTLYSNYFYYISNNTFSLYINKINIEIFLISTRLNKRL